MIMVYKFNKSYYSLSPIWALEYEKWFLELGIVYYANLYGVTVPSKPAV